MVKKIVITGAAGQIAYSLLFRIAQGELLGEKESIELSLLETKEGFNFLKGLVMELEDSAFPLLEKITTHSDPSKAFENADYLFLIGAKPRGPGMERKDLLAENSRIFIEQGKALSLASKEAIALVIGNPCNTNALILKKYSSFNQRRIFSMTKLDELRAKAFLAASLNVKTSAIHPLCIWGNHSKTLVVDYLNAKCNKEPLDALFKDKNFLKTTLQKTIQERGAEVIAARGKSSAASAANAALLAMKDLIFPTPAGTAFFSTSIYSEGNPYGIDPDLFFSFPCISFGNGKVEIVKGLKLDAFLKQALSQTEKELLEERESLKSE